MRKATSKLPPDETGFSMEEFDEIDSEVPWFPMHHDHRPGVARVWRVRSTAREAITKCCEWTGWVFIPAMQVRDLSTGEVIWRRSSDFEPDSGPDIYHPDEPVPSWKLTCEDEEWPPETTEQLSMLDG